jgi:hypothetical protein
LAPAPVGRGNPQDTAEHRSGGRYLSFGEVALSPFIPGFSPANVTELERHLQKIWSFGANIIVGWQIGALGLKVLYLPSYALARAAQAHPDLLSSERNLNTDADAHRLSKIGAQTASVALSFNVPPDDKVRHHINLFIRKFSITHCRFRCVSLFDIVNFSKYNHFDQITLITMLSHNLNVAARQCNRLGLPIELAMTTTGDGFYVWNNKRGIPADIALYTATMLALIYNNAALNIAETAAVPTLRCCVHFGRHFEYYQPRGDGGDSQGYIVGDVTIELARMMAMAMPNQILIGNYTARHDKWNAYEKHGIVDTETFMLAAQEGLKRLVGLRIPGGRIAGIRSYLTGDETLPGAFTIKTYSVLDKHAVEHPCFNAKLNFTDDAGNDIYMGCMDSDLANFGADRRRTEKQTA